MFRKLFEGFMEVFKDMTYKRKYLEEEGAKGSSKMNRTSVECPRYNNLDSASRHQVSDAIFCDGKEAEPQLSAQSMTII